jgi:hypothetical protein
VFFLYPEKQESNISRGEKNERCVGGNNGYEPHANVENTHVVSKPNGK